jgi:hypothetical protein
VAALVALAGALGGCSATRTPSPPSPAPTPCPAGAARTATDAICARDGAIRTLRARFRADVEAGGSARSAEGVLVWRAPDALRVKLFTLAGLTVYDALWVGDATRVRGVVRQPLSGRSERFDLGPGETTSSPDAALSLVLWSLWQARCARRPVAQGGDPQRFALDPAPARALGRAVVVADGEVREETLLRALAAGGDEQVIARYGDYECGLEPPLPRHIAMQAPASGWHAEVTIVDEARDVALDDRLFALPEGSSGNAGD